MSHQRVLKDAGWANEAKLPRGPNGRALCRRCNAEVPRGRRTFCSDECVHEWRLLSDQGYARGYVARRDRGVCAICRVDTDATRALISRGRERLGYDWLGRLERRLKIGHRHDLWDMDHTVPVAEGGGECGLNGYRTLCIWCHKRETRTLQARLKAERAAAKAREGLDP